MLVLSVIHSVISFIWNCLQSSIIFFQTVLQIFFMFYVVKTTILFYFSLLLHSEFCHSKQFFLFDIVCRQAKDLYVSSTMSTILLSTDKIINVISIVGRWIPFKNGCPKVSKSWCYEYLSTSGTVNHWLASKIWLLDLANLALWRCKVFWGPWHF